MVPEEIKQERLWKNHLAHTSSVIETYSIWNCSNLCSKSVRHWLRPQAKTHYEVVYLPFASKQIPIGQHGRHVQEDTDCMICFTDNS